MRLCVCSDFVWFWPLIKSQHKAHYSAAYRVTSSGRSQTMRSVLQNGGYCAASPRRVIVYTGFMHEEPRMWVDCRKTVARKYWSNCRLFAGISKKLERFIIINLEKQFLTWFLFCLWFSIWWVTQLSQNKLQHFPIFNLHWLSDCVT